MNFKKMLSTFSHAAKIYGTLTCPYCVRAKNLLKTLKMNYTFVSDEDEVLVLFYI